MSDDLRSTFYRNALVLLNSQRMIDPQVDAAIREIESVQITAGVVQWLANPFIQTALKILQKFSSNYKISQAIRLLQEAGLDERKKK